MKTVSLLAVPAAALLLGAAAADACTLHQAPAEVSAVAAAFPLAGAQLTKFGAAAPVVAGPTAAAAPLATTHRLRLVGRANPAGSYTADVWAHRSHAYVSSFGGQACPAAGVRVFDLARPSRPRHVATFASAASEPELVGTWTEKTIVKRVATPAFAGSLAVTSLQHCADGAFRGFALYDVTDPAQPRRLALVHTGVRGSHEIWLQERDGSAYVYTAIIDSETISAPDYDAARRTASAPGPADFRVYDVSNPAAPAQVAEWGAWRQLSINPHPAGAPVGPSHFVHSVRSNAAGTRAYLSYWDLGTVILDTTDPVAPRYLGRTPATRSAHSAALGRNGTLLVETHEVEGGLPTLFDISAPTRPRRLGQLSIPGAAIPAAGGARSFMNGVHDPDFLGKTLVLSWYAQGVIAADVSRPSRPRVLAQFLPPVQADPFDSLCPAGPCRAVWGVAVDRGYVLASDMVSGLYVLKLEPKPKRRPA